MSGNDLAARLYDPALGRFLEVDPVEGGSCNDYDYVCGDPVDQVDLRGLAPHAIQLSSGVCFCEESDIAGVFGAAEAQRFSDAKNSRGASAVERVRSLRGSDGDMKAMMVGQRSDKTPVCGAQDHSAGCEKQRNKPRQGDGVARQMREGCLGGVVVGSPLVTGGAATGVPGMAGACIAGALGNVMIGLL